MAGPMRKDMWATHLQVPGIDWHGKNIWDVKTGGEVDSDSFLYHPGGMEPQVSLGGKITTGNVTLSRLYRQDRDHLNLQKLLNAVGKSKATVVQQPLDADGNSWGDPIVYVGTLKRVNPPDTDSGGTQTTQDPAMIEVELLVEGVPHVG